MMTHQEFIAESIREILARVGEDPEREGLKGTPERWAKWFSEFIEYRDKNIETRFQAVESDQMVVVSGIDVWSLCEHHLLPFSSSISIGYIAVRRILGLSKFARVCHLLASRLQTQERLVSEIADDIQELTQARDVAVLARGRHLCMEMRGIKTPATMTTSVMRGAFLINPAARKEFMDLCARSD